VPIQVRLGGIIAAVADVVLTAEWEDLRDPGKETASAFVRDDPALGTYT